MVFPRKFRVADLNSAYAKTRRRSRGGSAAFPQVQKTRVVTENIFNLIAIVVKNIFEIASHSWLLLLNLIT